MAFVPTAVYVDGDGKGFDPPEMDVDEGGVVLTECYRIDTRNLLLARTATGLPTYGSPHPQDATLFVSKIKIEVVGGRDTAGDGSGGTSRALITYREADTQIDAGSGVILPPGGIFSRLLIEEGGTTRTYEFNSTGQPVLDRPLNYGQGVPVLKGAFMVEVTHAMWEDQFFAFMTPRLTRYFDLVTKPKTNSDVVRLPLWEGVRPAVNIIAQPGTLLYRGPVPQRANRVMQITHRLSFKASHRFEQQKYNGSGIAIGPPEPKRVYTKAPYADLWPFSTLPGSNEISLAGDE